ncbi:Tetratricopeptide repeat-containing protein [Singulisphaera sp. GP187]|uniref:tetratricopeptide repeat protein n=1 Tax=Singulisphaera sp. GP187 TaxID=1882752 RepID=UPI00092CA9A5|nr:tetratricopeptide repeat protein [Singulisphaera sp. GP187]SIO65453.1 Tetratricopeptide repeat-containing protein [Singulisphaera sp. GP187]
MTVRWKPLLVLSGLFLVIAIVGVVAIAYTLIPQGSSDILPQARAARSAKQYEKALIHYKRALQKDGRNAAIHEEIAKMYGEWAEQVPPEKKPEIQYGRIESLIAAARYGKTLKEPRRLLLADAVKRGVRPDILLWAGELHGLEPSNGDARYMLASEELEDKAPKVPDVKRHLDALVAAKAAPVRITWIKAKLAQQLRDSAAVAEALKQGRTLSLPADADLVDRMALLRLRELDVLTTEPTELDALAERVKALQAEVQTVLGDSPLAPTRLARLSALLEGVQKSLLRIASTSEPKTRDSLVSLVDAIDGNVESLFQKALEESNRPELQVYLSYAEHLRFRAKRDQCLALVEKALRLPSAARPNNAETVLGLHTIAVEVALSNAEDADRFTKANPHIAKLVESSSTIYQGLGHLFLGSIELENSGVSGTGRKKTPPTAPNPAQLKLRASALNHLKLAATQLPEFAEAQARYGVALVLSLESGLGRQYLQRAMQMGTLEPQYQIWAAWSIVQAGYPEEAAPIVDSLLAQVAQGRLPSELAGTLHLLNGEVHQARRSPEDLKLALAEYEKSFAKGETPTPPVQLRLAQIEGQLGKTEEALKRIDSLRKQGAGGPAAEHLAVLILDEQGKHTEARTILDEARKQFPDSDELVGLDAAMLVKAEKIEEADAVLADFITRNPDNIGITLTRAQLLSDTLKKPEEARKVLLSVADRSDNSGPLVQLALLDLRKHDHAAVAATIAKIRSRWKEAAIGDLLDAQLSLDENDLTGAVTHFEAALKKDPGNKLVQFWKAQLDSRTGATEEARESLEEIARAKPTKEVDGGLSLLTAAESSLAAIALESGDPDGAINRLEVLRGNGQNNLGGLSRADRWQLVTAYSAKGEWATAKREIASLLNDTKNKPTFDERVRGANYYRVHDEDAAALAQLDYVIQVDPAHPPAVVSRAYILARGKKFEESAALLKRAIAATTKEKPPAVFYLMLAAVDSLTPPKEDATARALATIETGLIAQPDSMELVHAKYRVLRSTQGDKAAIAYVEAKAEAGPKPVFRRMLVEIYSKHNDFTGAERVLRQLLDDNPKDSLVAANLVRVVGLQAIQASQLNKPDVEQTLNEKVAGMIREFRTRFPTDLTFLQAECDLAARRGDLTRATAITHEMDKIAKGSSSGPLTRARIYAAQGRIRETAEAYAEALERNPRQLDVQLLLGQAKLKLNEYAEAMSQAKRVLEIDNDQPDAVLLLARATAAQPGSDSKVAAHRAEAIEALTAAIRKNAKFAEAYHEKSEIQILLKDRKQAIATLKEAVEANPEDAAGLALLVQRLSETREDGRPATSEELAEAEKVAAQVGDSDEKGNMLLAIAVGYHKGGQLTAALPWAKKAASKLDVPLVHLNYGDLLLSIAEKTKDSADAKPYFEKAVEQYDLVLKSAANSVEAINNKAWILHTHLGRSAQALELANGFLKRVDPGTLPGEFFDTVGSIQEATGRSREAEDSYAKGLRKSPDHPVLNYHMGKLVASDRRRVTQAGTYLEKAIAGRDRLSPTMASDLESVMKKLSLKAN